MQSKEQKNKELQQPADSQVEVFEVHLPPAVAAKDESKDGMLKKLECED